MITAMTPAPFGRRLAARVIDLALVTSVVIAGVAVASGAVTTGDGEWAELGRFLMLLSIAAGLTLIAFVAIIVVPTAISGASAGKRLTGIRVVAVHGGAAGWYRSIAREATLPVAYLALTFVIGSVFSAMPPSHALNSLLDDLSVVVGPGLLVIDALFARRPDGRTGHDLIAGTTVVR
ncbi:RDD family protein [Actinoplanes sp. NPDC023801]|uniref:RDD family protein n=1 Tax=Actinoplanes sp. NPDC023801 TaxID=3154595 RepID=UPI0033EA6A6A